MTAAKELKHVYFGMSVQECMQTHAYIICVNIFNQNYKNKHVKRYKKEIKYYCTSKY